MEEVQPAQQKMGEQQAEPAQQQPSAAARSQPSPAGSPEAATAQGGVQAVSEESQEVPGVYSESFYLYSFKIVPCTATYAHNWSLCPFVHPNEKARRRDPRTHAYEPLPCPFDKKGTNCPYGNACSYTHNVYEYHLHPKRFRTQMCQQGAACRRPLCFFAHNLQELRFADAASDGAQPEQGVMPAGPPGAAQLAAAGMMGWQQAAGAAAAAASALGSPAAMYPGFAPAHGLGGAAGMPSPLQMMPAGVLPGGMPAAPFALQALSSPAAAAVGMQQQQAQWLSGYAPQGYVLLGGPQAQMMPAPQLVYWSPPMPAGGNVMGGSSSTSTAGGQQQGQVYASSSSSMRSTQQQQLQQQLQQQQWARGDRGGPALSPGSGGLVPLPPGAAGSSSSSSSCMRPKLALASEQEAVLVGGRACPRGTPAPPQQQQPGGCGYDVAPGAGLVSGATLSGSPYGSSSWGLAPLPSGPTTTTASMSLSGLSLPTTAGHNSCHSVPSSSSSSLPHLRPGAAGAAGTSTLDTLQAMQRMNLGDGGASSSQVCDL